MTADFSATDGSVSHTTSRQAQTPRSAKGAKLNRRGLETRARFIDTTIDMLAGGDPLTVSVNLIAKNANVTWGTVQHQFGDVDGLWQAVLDRLASERPILGELTDDDTVEGHVRAIVESLWSALDSKEARAVSTLRACLPRGTAELARSFPKTAQALTQWDSHWRRAYAKAFQGLVVEASRLEEVRNLLPGAVRGLHVEQGLSTWTDIEQAKAGLIGAVSLYLQPNRPSRRGPR